MINLSYNVPCINLLSNYSEVIEAYNWVKNSFLALDQSNELKESVNFEVNGFSYSGASIEEFKLEAFGSTIKVNSFTMWTKSEHEAYLNYCVPAVPPHQHSINGVLLAHDKKLLIKAVDMLALQEINSQGEQKGRSNTYILLPKFNKEKSELLLSDINRSIENNEPELVLDRLHTFSMNFLRDLCNKYNLKSKDEKGNGLPLHSLLGKIKNYLTCQTVINSDFTKQALSANISILDKYNFVRNQESFAHDNEVMNKIEATFAIKTVANIIVLLSELDKLVDK